MNSHHSQIITIIENILKTTIVATNTPKQGMGSEVFILKNDQGKEFVAKWSNSAHDEYRVLDVVKQLQRDIPIPKVYGYFPYENKGVLLLEKIPFPLLEQINATESHLCIPSVISTLHNIHTITSDQLHVLPHSISQQSWKEWMLSKYSGTHPDFPWTEIVKRDGVDANLILSSVKAIQEKIKQQSFIHNGYSLLHTDFNQRNFFINPQTFEVAGIIDWAEAMYGDPLYDFARVRMYIWHFQLGNETLKTYFNLLNMTREEKQREELYLVDQILHYIAWYSEDNSEFSKGRLKLHQEFLKGYSW